MSWRDKGYFSPASTGNDGSAAVLEFAQGGTAMIICGSWLLSNVKGANEDLNFGVYKLANEEDGKIYSCITANGAYSIAANTQNLDNADEENWVPLWNGQITVEEFANRVAEQQDAVK